MKLIVLDRDGVINQDSEAFVKSPDEFIPLSGSLEAIARLHHAGYKVVIATNQSGIGRGLFDMPTLNQMHQKLQALLHDLGARIDAFFICPHRPEDGCTCRKPALGMFEDIKRRYEIDATKCIAVGDSLRDLQAANMAGFNTCLVLTGNGQKTNSRGNLPPGTLVHECLATFVDEFLTE